MANQMNKDQNRNSSNQSMGGQKPERTGGSQEDLGNQQQQRNQKGSDVGTRKSSSRDIQE